MTHKQILEELDHELANWQKLYQEKYPDSKAIHRDKDGNEIGEKWIYIMNQSSVVKLEIHEKAIEKFRKLINKTQ